MYCISVIGVFRHPPSIDRWITMKGIWKGTTVLAVVASLLMIRIQGVQGEQTRVADPLRLALLVEPSPLTYVSGYTNRFLALFQHLDKLGDSVEIITTEVVVEKEKRPQTHLGFPVIYTKGFRLPFYRSMTVSCDWTLVVPRVLLRYRPHVIHVTTPGIYIFSAILWSRLLQIPLVMSYHTHLPVYIRSYLAQPVARILEPVVWFLLRAVNSLADVTLVTSTAIQQEFHRQGMRNIHVWPKAVNTTRFHPQWRSTEWRKRLTNNHTDACLLLYVGRLAPEKRLHELKAVMNKLSPHYRLAFVGQGPSQEELQSLFADCDRTTFLGPLYGEDLQAAYASADIFVMPSDSETLGFVVMEAMASGLAVVGAAAGGIPDLIRNGETGLLVSTSDVDGYVQAIQSIGLNQGARRRKMGRQARKSTETWTWDDSMTVLTQCIYPLAMQNRQKRLEQRLWKFFKKSKCQ